MKVIVCGAGQVGFNIARHLASLQNDVTVIDRSPELIRKIGESLDVQGLVGHAADPEMLERASASDADLLVAVTISDEVNMVACQVASSLFQIPTKIARIRNQVYLRTNWADLFARENLPIDVIISPEREVARALARRLAVPGAFNVVPFMDGRAQILGVLLDETCPVLDTPLRQLTELFPNLGITIVGINRRGKLFVPGSSDSLQAGDSIYLAVETGLTDRALAVFGREEDPAGRIVIVGGGNIGQFLAQELEQLKPLPNIKLVEREPLRAKAIAEKLAHTIVIQGDALEAEIMNEANVADAETIVTVADDDQVNILSALLAKRLGCDRAITLMNNPLYGNLVGSIGIDVALDPRETTVSSIVRHIRKGRVRDLYSLQDGEAEILEIEVLEGSEVVGKDLSDIKFGKGVRIGKIIRGDELVTPSSRERLNPGDTVLLLAISDHLNRVEALFSARADVF